MPLESSASSVLGPDLSTPQVAVGSRGGGIPSRTFNAMDQRFMQKAEEILAFKDRVATLKDRESARVQGNMAMGEITQLDPTNENYLAQRNQIISKYPKAALDNTAGKFLDLQEDEFTTSSRRREYDYQRGATFDMEMKRMEAYAEQNEEKAAIQTAREYNRAVMEMSSPAQTAYYELLNDGEDPTRAFTIAKRIYTTEQNQNKYIEQGGRAEDFYNPDGTPRTERELAELQGSRTRTRYEREDVDRQIEAREAQHKAVSREIEQLTSRLDSEDVAFMPPEQQEQVKSEIRKTIATLQKEADGYLEQMANLRGLSSESQRAGSSNNPAGGGSPTGGNNSESGGYLKFLKSRNPDANTNTN